LLHYYKLCRFASCSHIFFVLFCFFSKRRRRLGDRQTTSCTNSRTGSRPSELHSNNEVRLCPSFRTLETSPKSYQKYFFLIDFFCERQCLLPKNCNSACRQAKQNLWSKCKVCLRVVLRFAYRRILQISLVKNMLLGIIDLNFCFKACS